jgi:hypothetical protein
VSGWRRWLQETARSYGGTVSHTGGGHLVVLLPSGAKIYASATPSDQRTRLHVRAAIRRAIR